MPRVSRIERVEQKLDQFLSNDWVHAQLHIESMNVKLNLMLAVIGLVVLGVFVPLAVKLWSNWLQ